MDDELVFRRDAGVTDAALAVDSAEPDVPYPVRPGCPQRIRLEGRDASVPVDVIWVVRGSSDLLEAFRRTTANYWSALVERRVDTMNILIVGHEDSIAGPEGSFAGRVRYLSHAAGDPGVALAESFEYYAPLLRPDSRRHVVVVSSISTIFTPAELHRTLSDQLGEYTLHAIVSPQLDPSFDNPLGVCVNSMGSADRSDIVFPQLAERTGGTQHSICAEDWNPLIDRLNERIAIRIPIPCAFTLPIIRPPGIRRYEPRGIRLRSHVGDVSELLRSVEGPRQCFAGDWWLFAGSDRLHLCPDTCARLEESRAALDVELDCGY